MRPRFSLLTFLAAPLVACLWVACTQDFDQFAPGPPLNQGGGDPTTTTGAAGGPPTTSSTGGAGGVGGVGGEGGAGGGNIGGSGGEGGAPPPTCGDGDQQDGEACDDGNTLPADGCSSTCTVEEPDTCPGPTVPLTGAGFVITGDTTGALNDAGETPCGGGQSGEWVYEITPDQDGIMTATLEGLFDTLLYTRSACPGNQASNLECGFMHGPATLIMQVTAGEPFFLFVDGYGPMPEEGAFTLTLELN